MKKMIISYVDSKFNRGMISGAVLIVKMILMGCFSSDYQDQMFIPFVNAFLSGNNPYELFYINNLPVSFPYFPFMLMVEAVGGSIVRFFSTIGVFWQNFLFKIPLLIFDVIGYIMLRKLSVRFKYATIFYFCSPIIIYGTYVHGQLDIIPTVFLIVAIYYLLAWKKQKNLAIYAVFLGLAIGCKFHIMAAVPILFLYVAKKKDYMMAVKYHLISVLIVFAGCIPFWGKGFVQTVIFNKEQSALMAVSLDYGAVQLAGPVIVLLIVYLNVYELNYFNKNLLISMLGLLFTVFLICIAPMPAWKSAIFSMMVAALGVIVYKIYRFGIASNELYQRRGNSFVIGIAGDSGAGKSRLLEKIEHLFGTGKDVLFIEGDGDHRWARNDKNWEQFTALDPQAHYLYRQAEDIRRLKKGNHVFRAENDHNTGSLTVPRKVNTKKYIVLSGLHSLYLPALRDELDLKIFMDTDNELRNYWKIERDTKTRGHSKEETVEQIRKRLLDAEKYIYPQKAYADLIVTYFDKTLESCYQENHIVELSVKFSFNINLDIERLLNLNYSRQYKIA